MKRAKRMDLFQSSIFTELKNMKLDYTRNEQEMRQLIFL